MVRVRCLFANIDLSYGIDNVYIRNQIIDYAGTIVFKACTLASVRAVGEARTTV